MEYFPCNYNKREREIEGEREGEEETDRQTETEGGREQKET